MAVSGCCFWTEVGAFLFLSSLHGQCGVPLHAPLQKLARHSGPSDKGVSAWLPHEKIPLPPMQLARNLWGDDATVLDITFPDKHSPRFSSEIIITTAVAKMVIF